MKGATRETDAGCGAVVYSLERVKPAKGKRLKSGGLSGLRPELMKELRRRAVAYARREIGRYGRWRGSANPVLPDGYDAEGIVQQSLVKLLEREREDGPRAASVDEIRGELRRLIEHRVLWLRQRRETELVTGEWDVLPPDRNGELVSIFDWIPGTMEGPDLALMRKEKALGLEKLKGEFEVWLGDREELRVVFRRVWEGGKRREIAAELGLSAARVTNLQKQVQRCLAEFVVRRPVAERVVI